MPAPHPHTVAASARLRKLNAVPRPPKLLTPAGAEAEMEDAAA